LIVLQKQYPDLNYDDASEILNIAKSKLLNFCIYFKIRLVPSHIVSKKEKQERLDWIKSKGLNLRKSESGMTARHLDRALFMWGKNNKGRVPVRR
jgi:hypothetical protein